MGEAATKDAKRSVFIGNVPFDIKDDEVCVHACMSIDLQRQRCVENSFVSSDHAHR